MKRTRNQLRIIAGKWKGRKLSFLDQPGLRPTPGRVKETLFNWLQHDVSGSRCLDLFAGSGALGIEAASRGAELVALVEHSHKVCETLKANTLCLNGAPIEVVHSEATKFLSGNTQAFDLVFLDPPFGEQLVLKCCQMLENKGWLEQQAKIYVEAESGLSMAGVPDNWKLLRRKKTGEVKYHLFQRNDNN